MPYSEINGNNSLQIATQVASATNYFEWGLVFLFLVFGIGSFTIQSRQNRGSFFGSFATAGLITTLVGAILLTHNLISIEAISISIAVTTVCMIGNFFND